MGSLLHLRVSALLVASLFVSAQTTTETDKPQEAISAILKLFDSYRVVIVGEAHLCIEQHEFFKSLVNAPDFAGRINDIVIESANSLYQPTLDRYIAGESVPPRDLEKVWQNVVGAPGDLPFHRIMDCWRRSAPGIRNCP